jgi:coenzyme PQQ synthesis protein D (PqqD)
MTAPVPLSFRVEISEQTLSQELNGETVLLELSRGMYFGLDEVGTRIWQLLVRGDSLDEIVAALVDEYEVSADAAAADLRALVAELEERRLVEVRR